MDLYMEGESEMKMVNYALLFVCITFPFCLILDLKIQMAKESAKQEAKNYIVMESRTEEMQNHGE